MDEGFVVVVLGVLVFCGFFLFNSFLILPVGTSSRWPACVKNAGRHPELHLKHFSSSQKDT